MKPFVIACLLLATPAGAATTYVDTTEVFSVTIPNRWHAERANFSVTHYRGVFFCVNNKAPGIRIHDVNGGYVTDMADKLPKGTVYVDFAHFDGPARVAMFGPGRDDTAEQMLRAFVRSPEKNSGKDGLEWYELNFMKWGGNWNIWIFCRKPYDRKDFQHALEMLETLQFPELPITSAHQAVKAAMEKLPAAGKTYDPRAGVGDCSPEDGWLARGGRFGSRETRVLRQGKRFDVVFRLYTTPNGKDVAHEWKYLVQRDGSVTTQ